MIEYKMIHPYPYLYHFRDPQGVCFSIIKGTKFSLVVDCGYGIGNVRECVEKYIDTPYTVVNTHGHMDHASGNFQFDEAYLSEKDFGIYERNLSIEQRKNNLEVAVARGLIDESYDQDAYLNAKSNCKIIPVSEGHIFDLGDMHVEVISMEGHTQGSIGLLIKEHKLLLTGDAAIHMIWLFLKESTDRPTYIKMLERVKKLDFDNFITGHLMEVYPKRLFDYYLEVAKESKPSNSVPFHSAGFERPNAYQYSKVFEGINIGIVYQDPISDK